jgi:hypothetical protein
MRKLLANVPGRYAALAIGSGRTGASAGKAATPIACYAGIGHRVVIGVVNANRGG